MLASVDEQASLSLTWSETPEDTFSHNEAQIYLSWLMWKGWLWHKQIVKAQALAKLRAIPTNSKWALKKLFVERDMLSLTMCVHC